MSESATPAPSAPEQCERTLHFLLEAAHKYALLAPAVSRSMMAQLRGVSAKQKCVLHNSVTQRFCNHCSQVYVPGSNCHVYISRVRKRRCLVKRKNKSTFGKVKSMKLMQGNQKWSDNKNTRGSNKGGKEGKTGKGGKVGKGGNGGKGFQGGSTTGASASAQRGALKCVRYACDVCSKSQRLQVLPRFSKLPGSGPRHSASGARQSKFSREAEEAAAALKRARMARKAAPSNVGKADHCQHQGRADTVAGTAAEGQPSQDLHSVPHQDMDSLCKAGVVEGSSPDNSLRTLPAAPQQEGSSMASSPDIPKVTQPPIAAMAKQPPLLNPIPTKDDTENTSKRKRRRQEKMQTALQAMGAQSQSSGFSFQF